ncbi:MAG: O-antigen ligase family protein [Phycisphaerae bacterium]|nr:O-antigen ligase family protein [Phycisphaerae bacterium]
MLTVGQQRIDPLALIAVGALTALAIALSLVVPHALPWALAALAAAGLLVFWAGRWEITVWTWLWVLSYGLLNWPEWEITLAGFFNLTVPRLIFVVALAAFALHFLFHRRRLHFDRGLLWVMLLLAVCVGLSAWATGWTTRIRQPQEIVSAPYYRFLGSIVMPFVMFLLVYNVVRRERQITWALVLVSIYGWFALYTGYLQYAAIRGLPAARMLIWPAYINNPEYGHHFDRARGAFSAAGPQAVFLVLLFYVDLYLLRRVRGTGKAVFAVQALLVPPAIFFTGLRSAYLAFALCGIVWLLWADRRRLGAAKLVFLGLAVLIAVVTLWETLSGTDRMRGGMGQVQPVVARKILVAQTWEMVKRRPFFGVGFGHFVDAQHEMRRDPTSLVGLSGGVLVEHNLFLNMAAEMGLVGVTLTVAVFVLLFRESLRLYRKLPSGASGMLSRSFVILFWIAMVNYLTDAMFRDTLWDVFANGLFWSLAGLVVAYNRLLEPQPLELPPAASAVRR